MLISLALGAAILGGFILFSTIVLYFDMKDVEARIARGEDVSPDDVSMWP